MLRADACTVRKLSNPQPDRAIANFLQEEDIRTPVLSELRRIQPGRCRLLRESCQLSPGTAFSAQLGSRASANESPKHSYKLRT